MNGQVGAESSGVCGPARVEAVDWHPAHAAQGAQCWFSDCEVDPDHLLVTEGVTSCHRAGPHLDCERLYFVFRLLHYIYYILYYAHFSITFSQLHGVTPTSLENLMCTYVSQWINLYSVRRGIIHTYIVCCICIGESSLHSSWLIPVILVKVLCVWLEKASVKVQGLCGLYISIHLWLQSAVYTLHKQIMTPTVGKHLKAHLLVGCFSNVRHFTDIMLYMMLASSCFFLSSTC